MDRDKAGSMYQGIAIIKAGAFGKFSLPVPVYYSEGTKDMFTKAVRRGSMVEGSGAFVDSVWLDSPLDRKGIKQVGREMVSKY